MVYQDYSCIFAVRNLKLYYMETSAKIKFENDKDFVNGVISMGEMLETWQSTADNGTVRTFKLDPNSAELSLGILLKVTK